MTGVKLSHKVVCGIAAKPFSDLCVNSGGKNLPNIIGDDDNDDDDGMPEW
jgi:hypothetical protein